LIVPIEADKNKLDKPANILRDLRTQPHVSIRIPQEAHSKHLTVVVGKPNFVEQETGGLTAIPTTFSLYQNYPNPFNPTTMVRYVLPGAGEVTLQVFDLLGRKVATLEERKERDAGFYEAVADKSRLSSGMYFYQIILDGETRLSVSKRMPLVK